MIIHEYISYPSRQIPIFSSLPILALFRSPLVLGDELSRTVLSQHALTKVPILVILPLAVHWAAPVEAFSAPRLPSVGAMSCVPCSSATSRVVDNSHGSPVSASSLIPPAWFGGPRFLGFLGRLRVSS
jgi:hypothetical protein